MAGRFAVARFGVVDRGRSPGRAGDGRARWRGEQSLRRAAGRGVDESLHRRGVGLDSDHRAPGPQARDPRAGAALFESRRALVRRRRLGAAARCARPLDRAWHALLHRVRPGGLPPDPERVVERARARERRSLPARVRRGLRGGDPRPGGQRLDGPDPGRHDLHLRRRRVRARLSWTGSFPRSRRLLVHDGLARDAPRGSERKPARDRVGEGREYADSGLDPLRRQRRCIDPPPPSASASRTRTWRRSGARSFEHSRTASTNSSCAGSGP